MSELCKTGLHRAMALLLTDSAAGAPPGHLTFPRGSIITWLRKRAQRSDPR